MLTQGCFSRVQGSIKDCYELELTSNPSQQLDSGSYSKDLTDITFHSVIDLHTGSPRQRIEFLTAKQTPGRMYTYQWKQFIAPGVSTSSKFFHLMQVFSHEDGGPIVTLDGVANTAAVKDYKRDCAQTGCPSIPWSSFTDITTKHFISYAHSTQHGGMLA